MESTGGNYWEIVAAGRENINTLLALAQSKQYSNEYAKIKRLDEQRRRVERWIGQPRFDRRARLIRATANSRIHKFYEEYVLPIRRDLFLVLESLREVLHCHEVGKTLAMGVAPQSYQSVCATLQLAAKILHELWISRPDPEQSVFGRKKDSNNTQPPAADEAVDEASPTKAVEGDDRRESRPDNKFVDRGAEIHAYKRECRAAGIKVTDLDIAKEADPRWNTRDPVAKWKAGKDRPGDDSKIRRVLREKPHLKAKT